MNLTQTAVQNLERLKAFITSAQVHPLIRAGHTTGSVMYLLESGTEKMMFWGDINHAGPVQMQQCKVAIHFDIDQVQAIRTRQQALRDAADHSYLVGAARIIFGELCGWSISGKVIVRSRQIVKPGAIQKVVILGMLQPVL